MGEEVRPNIMSEDKLSRVEGLFSLAQKDLFEHLIDPESGRQYLALCEGIEYPDSGEIESADVILPTRTTEQGRSLLLLPEDFVTMAQALNDTIGDYSSNSLFMARGLFEKLGDELSIIVNFDGVVPENIHYRQIVMAKEEQGLGVKILPPLKFQPKSDAVHSEMDAKTLITQQLFQSCYYGAANKAQKDALPIAFRGFIDAFGR